MIQIDGLEAYWLFAGILNSRWNVELCEWTISNYEACCQDVARNGENGI